MDVNFKNALLVSGLSIALININISQAAWAPARGKQQLMKDVAELDSLSTKFNQEAKSTERVNNLLSSFERLLGRSLAGEERSFFKNEFGSLEDLPRFEVSNNAINIYEVDGKAKDLLLSIEIVDAEKNIFKHKGHTFQVNANKPLHENIQFILRELQKGDGA